MDGLKKVTDWEFLQEPLWRWGVFFLAVGAMGFAWNGVIDHMR